MIPWWISAALVFFGPCKRASYRGSYYLYRGYSFPFIDYLCVVFPDYFCRSRLVAYVWGATEILADKYWCFLGGILSSRLGPLI